MILIYYHTQLSRFTLWCYPEHNISSINQKIGVLRSSISEDCGNIEAPSWYHHIHNMMQYNMQFSTIRISPISTELFTKQSKNLQKHQNICWCACAACDLIYHSYRYICTLHTHKYSSNVYYCMLKNFHCNVHFVNFT